MQKPKVKNGFNNSKFNFQIKTLLPKQFNNTTCLDGILTAGKFNSTYEVYDDSQERISISRSKMNENMKSSKLESQK